MDRESLKQILESAYDDDTWRQVLLEVFGVRELRQRAEDITKKLNDKDRKLAEMAHEIVRFETSNGEVVGCFRVDLTDQPRIWQNRVGLRQLLRSVYRHDVDAALVVFVQPDQKKWRLSLVSEIRVLESGAWVERKTETKRYTYLLGEDEIARTTSEQLDSYRLSERSLDSLIKAFSVEKVTRDFFRDYKVAFDALEVEIERSITDQVEARLFSQRLLNRLMFLYFIQRKGWMSYEGDQNYLRSVFNSAMAKDENFYRDRLYWIFFYGLSLNAERLEVKDEQFLQNRRGHVKYLNGGLFEMEAWDEKGKVAISNGRFVEILELFERYNFTIDESTPFEIQIAVDPEMLGKVFEELVTSRHSSGSYYTPRTVVSFMCREALKHALAKTDSAEAIARLVDENDGSKVHDPDAILKRLRQLTICDPACGSGAYLLGMLQELVHIREALFAAEKIDPEAQYRWKREIIESSIYGVDVDRFATQIAALRLWLSLAIESDIPHPLPNLKYKIGCGDSLLAPIEAVGRTPDLYRTERVNELQRLKAMSTHPDDPSDQAAKRAIDEQIDQIRAEIAEMLDHDEPEGVFDWSVEFAEVFEDGGFDIVLANPPYVRQEEIKPKAYKDKLLKIYSGSMAGKSDLYVAFYQRGIELLRDGGTHVFVCSNSWLDVGYGAKLQKYLLDRGHIAAVYDSAIERQFSTAAINTIISFIHKQKPSDEDVSRFVSLRAPFNEALADELKCRIVARTRRELIESGSDESRKYKGDKWGGKYLRGSGIFETIQEKGVSFTGQLSEYFRGERYLNTGGADGFFLLGDVERLDNGNYWICNNKVLDEDSLFEGELEADFLTPLVKQYTKRNKRIEIDGFDAYCLTVNRNPSAKLRKYIAWGERQGYSDRSAVRLRNPWYAPTNQMKTGADVLVPRSFGSSFIIYSNPKKYLSLRFYRFHVIAGKVEQLTAFLNSSIFAFYLESLGNKALGHGVLDFFMADSLSMRVPIVLNRELEYLYQTFKSREIKEIFQELDEPDRHDLDNIIFDALKLTMGERDAVYETIIDLVSKRLQRAQTITG